MQTAGNIENEDELLHWQSRLERIKEYVWANLAADLSSRTIAQKFGFNESTLRYLFQSEEDESFHDYVERMRMAKALQLLSEGKWVKEAMREVGYSNRGTFNNAFKRRFKHTPGSFKK
jgi:AraC-like DNA-binding protein